MAKKRKLITRGRLKRGLLISALAVVLIAISSVYATYTLIWVTGDDAFVFRVIGGSVVMVISWDDPALLARIVSVLENGVSINPSPYLFWSFDFHNKLGDRSLLAVVPLWAPLLIIAAAAAWLWRTDRRAKPRQCDNCRYDLRGLANEGNGAVCPECGLESNAGVGS